jgi:hypothetical protein
MMQDKMDKVHDTRRAPVVRQWKQELELLRLEISRQHDHVVERMRADETSLLEALYSFAESKHRRLGKTAAVCGPPPSARARRQTDDQKRSSAPPALTE